MSITPKIPQSKKTIHPLRKKSFPPYLYSQKRTICLLLMVTTLAVFWPLINHEFINFDDDLYVYDNSQVRTGLTLKGVIWAFTTTRTSNWHPLTWLSHMTDCELYGLWPGGHHLTNLLFHIANTLLLFLVLNRMTRALWSSSLVAALFALHPLHVESVAWVAERKDVLSTLFWMLTLGAYVHYTALRSLNWYIAALSFFTLGLLSKPMLITLPCVMLLLDYWPLGRFRWGKPVGHWNSNILPPVYRKEKSAFTHRIVLEKVPFLVLSAISSIVTFFVQQSGGAVQSLESFPLRIRISNALLSYLSYIGKMIWPHPLAVFYPYRDIFPTWQAAGTGVLLMGVTVLFLRAARKYPYLVVGWLWYLGTLVPVIGLVQVGAQAMADRYTYVPLIGIFIMVAWGLPQILAGWRFRKTALATATALLLSIFVALTGLQLQKWHDRITLFTYTLSVTTRNALIHNNLGNALSNQGKYREAITHYTEALRIRPQYAEAYYNFGVALAHQGKTEEAIAQYTEALRINPKHVNAHNNLGNALAHQGKNEEAVAQYTEALRINQNNAVAHKNLGLALMRQGKYEEAIAHYNEALRLNPQYADARNNLGNALASQEKIDEAIVQYTEALRINPNHANAHYNLENALALQRRNDEARAHQLEAMRINSGKNNNPSSTP